MLWLALHLPHLALEVHARGGISGPLAVTENATTKGRLLLCDATAHACGVRPGMTATSAWALCANLKIMPRAPLAECHALERIAAWACQFTSQVSIAGAAELLLEIGGSLALFGGIAPIRTKIGHGLQQLGYSYRMACAPTPLAAQWFARTGISACLDHPENLSLALNGLPVQVLQSTEAALALERFGSRTIGDCRQLPRDGLAQRLGQEALDEIDRALGKLPDPRPLFKPPRIFSSTLTLPAPAEHAAALLFAARRLYAEMCGHLVATGQGAQRLEFTFYHERRQRTRLALNLVTASRDPEHLLALLRERLAALQLTQPATAIRLVCTQQQALAAENQPLLPNSRTRTEAGIRLLEKLQARLGTAAICGLRLFADHRPEQAWRACAPEERTAPSASPALGERPLWLLQCPRALHEQGAVPHCDGPLTLLAGPERIETGWWDDHAVVRDYFIARNQAQALLWIYREHGMRARWFLQGFFS